MAGIEFKMSPLPGGGPWRILPECPSILHNTERQATTGPAAQRCICPRGKALAEKRNAKRLASIHRLRAARRAVGQPVHGLVLRNVLDFDPVPHERADIRFGACRNSEGRKFLDRILDKQGRRTSAQRQFKARFCDVCPLKAKSACLMLGMETREVGVYGGLNEAEIRGLLGVQS